MANVKKNLTVRVSDSDREFILLRGNGQLNQGIEAIIERYREIVKAFTPKKQFTKNELCAIAGANKGTMWQYRISDLPRDMAANIEDYPACEAVEASQWTGVDFSVLAEKVAALHPAQAVAVMDAIDAFFESGKEMHEIIPAMV